MKAYSVNTIYMDGPDEKDFIRVESNQTIIYQIPRRYADLMSDEAELKNAGIYFLVQENKRNVYIGQADARNNGNGVLGRMLEPHGRQEIAEWNYGYAIINRIPYFLGATELNYLERFFYEFAGKIERYTLLNKNRPHAANVRHSSQVDLQNFIEDILFLLENHTRCKVYVPRYSQKKKASIQKRSLTGGTCVVLDSPFREAHAEGVIADDGKGIIVKKGSKVSRRNSLSYQSGKKYQNEVRTQLMNNGTIIDFTFTRDYSFPNTSQAASIILGMSASGPARWHVKNAELSFAGDLNKEKEQNK